MANTASFSFQPVSQSVTAGDVFPVDVLMYTGSESVVSSDVWISYDPKMVTPVIEGKDGIVGGEFFAVTEAKIISPGNLYIFALNTVQGASAEANGKLATIQFRAETSGTTELSFACIPFQKKTSQIIRKDASLTNIINCTSTRTHTSELTIEPGNVLGASTTVYTPMLPMSLIIMGAFFFGILYFRYKRLAKRLTTT